MARNVVILGGGSAGWMTAAYLNQAFGKAIDVTLVESPSIGTIGVGEATFSTIKLFFDYLGLQEHEWMPHCNASYKLAIKFIDWTSAGGYFYHPFERYEVVSGFNLGEWWLKLKRDTERFDEACFIIPALCDANRSPRTLDDLVFDEQARPQFTAEHMGRKTMLRNHRVQFPYGYHFDAGLLAEFLKKHATQRGVRQVLDDVVDVGLREDGSILHLKTREHGAITGDLFVDCTGFQGLLINKVLGEPFISFSDSLLCDSAVALQVPAHNARDGIEPFTTATARPAGWIWKIPLYGRMGTGHVYSSGFISKEDAEAELRRYVGPAANDCRANHIKMRIGRNRGSWRKNCVAIGLASGFVEPLESTGIFFIQHGIEELVSHFPSGPIDERMVKSYNQSVGDCIDGVRDFLILHYRSSDRADTPFWRATKNVHLSESLQERLELWKTRLPDVWNINPRYHGFEFYSYSVMLLGLNYRPPSNLPVLEHMDAEGALQAFQKLKEKAHHLVATLPSLYDYLTHVRRTRGAPPRYE
jgi:flavin-dependent dehydrogenase